MKFRAAKIEALLLEELLTPSWPLEYLGWKPEEHLVAPPRSQRFRNAHEVGYRWLWVVMDERPGMTEGFLVTFDPRIGIDGAYGLATKPHRRRLGEFLGYAGNLARALEAIYESSPHGNPPGLWLPGTPGPRDVFQTQRTRRASKMVRSD